MSIDWFRWYHGTVNDPKWRVVAKKSGCRLTDVLAVFSAFLERASSTNDSGSIEGWDAEDIAAALDIEPEEVVAIHAAMQGKVLDGDILSGWRKRQPKRERDDDSKERVRRHREAKKSAISDDVTPCNATQRQETPRLRLDETRQEEEIANALLSPDEPTTTETELSEPDAEQEAFDAYNDLADRIGIPRAQVLNATRKSKLRQRLKECGGLSGWVAALEKLEASSFCRGERSDFRADLDFLLQAQSFTRLMEGRYDDRTKPNRPTNSRVSSPDEVRRRLAAAVSASLDDGGTGSGWNH